MPKKPRQDRRRDILNRTVDIAPFRTSLRVGVDEPKDPEPEIEVKPWLEPRGVRSLRVDPCDGRSASVAFSTTTIRQRSRPE